MGALAVAMLAAAALPHGRPLLVWNPSPSSPQGLYAIALSRGFAANDIVIARPPAAAARLAAERGYLPRGVPLVKSVVAVEGNRMCADRNRVWVNGRNVALRLTVDAAGRPLPWWSGCRVLAKGEALLLGLGHPASFDGRYFGPSRAGEVLGKAKLLWAA